MKHSVDLSTTAAAFILFLWVNSYMGYIKYWKQWHHPVTHQFRSNEGILSNVQKFMFSECRISFTSCNSKWGYKIGYRWRGKIFNLRIIKKGKSSWRSVWSVTVPSRIRWRLSGAQPPGRVAGWSTAKEQGSVLQEAGVSGGGEALTATNAICRLEYVSCPLLLYTFYQSGN